MTDKNPGDNPGKTVVDIAVERMREETESLKMQLKAATDALTEVTAERNKAASFLEQNERGIAIEGLRKSGCTYSVEEFDKMNVNQLAELKSHYKYFNPPTFKSGADVSVKRKSSFDSLDNIYTSLEDRSKGLSEA